MISRCIVVMVVYCMMAPKATIIDIIALSIMTMTIIARTAATATKIRNN